MKNNANNALLNACEIAGGNAALAEIIGATPQRLQNWLTRGVPADWVLPIYHAVKGRVSPHLLRPDVYPDPNYRPAITRKAQSPAPQGAVNANA